MNNGMINSLVGMHAFQQRIDSIANNIANINTVGYKSREVFFEEILANRMKQPGEFQLDGRMTAPGLDRGYGTRTALTLANFSQGAQMDTGVDTDMMITGESIFFSTSQTVPAEENNITYTRNGNFQVDAMGQLITADGSFILNTENEAIILPQGAKLKVDEFGNVFAQTNNGELEELGTLKLAKIKTPQVLEQVGESKYKIPESLIQQGIEILDTEFAANGSGSYRVTQGALESSNLNFAKEMVQLNEAQRAYQFLSRGLSISDQMLGIANNLRG